MTCYNAQMLGVVTLYHPSPQEAAENILRYIQDVDALIIWDNSPLDANLRQQISGILGAEIKKVIWYGDGTNHFIAPAINYALHYALKKHFDLLLFMDQDSQWENFASYRNDVERHWLEGEKWVYTPYVIGCDTFTITQNEQEKRLFINSGTIIPTSLLNAIGGIDEQAFPLDAIDHDLAFSIKENGYHAYCLTQHRLFHSLGNPQRMGIFHIFTPNYDRHRTFSMTRSHIICYRKHKALMTTEDSDYLYNEIIRRKIIRILFAEPDKIGRFMALIKGIVSGYCFKI